jgi:putative ABC transport system permease protein
VDLASGLKRGASQTGAAGLNLLSGKSALVVAEIALSLILLTGAGLMLKSYQRMLSMRIGIDPENVLTMRMSLPDSEVHQATAFWSEVERRAAALPGVESAGLGNCYALAGRCNATILTFRDRPEAAPGTAPTVGVQFVSPDSFRTLKIPLLRGRGFTSADHAGAPKVVLINQTAAQQLWPGEDPIGKPVAVGQGGFSDGAEVVGIVGDVRYARLDAVPVPTVYISYLQSTRTSLILFVRSARDASDLTAAVREQVRQIEKDVPVFDAMTMNERIRSSTAASRFTATLLAVFAGVAILLAAIGIYGTLSYLVSQRTREIGIRVAMGARPLNVVGLVLVRGAFLTAIGLAVGLIGAYASTRLLASMLYQIKPDDPGTFAEIALLLGAVALSATVIPARRAAKVDAMVALRSE